MLPNVVSERHVSDHDVLCGYALLCRDRCSNQATAVSDYGSSCECCDQCGGAAMGSDSDRAGSLAVSHRMQFSSVHGNELVYHVFRHRHVRAPGDL